MQTCTSQGLLVFAHSRNVCNAPEWQFPEGLTCFYSQGNINEICLKHILHLIFPSCFAVPFWLSLLRSNHLVSFCSLFQPLIQKPHSIFFSWIPFYDFVSLSSQTRVPLCVCIWGLVTPVAWNRAILTLLSLEFTMIHHFRAERQRERAIEIGWVFSRVTTFSWWTSARETVSQKEFESFGEGVSNVIMDG